jgi:hypothetical protein
MFQTKKYYDPRKWMRERNNFQYETRASICWLEKMWIHYKLKLEL